MLHLSHFVKSMPIWSYSGLYFAAFGLNTEKCGVFEVSLRIQSEYIKIQTRITPNTDIFSRSLVLP